MGAKTSHCVKSQPYGEKILKTRVKVHSHARTKHNYTNGFSPSKSKIMPVPFTILKHLRGLMCGGTVYFSVVECKVWAGRQLRKIFIFAGFFKVPHEVS